MPVANFEFLIAKIRSARTLADVASADHGLRDRLMDALRQTPIDVTKLSITEGVEEQEKNSYRKICSATAGEGIVRIAIVLDRMPKDEAAIFLAVDGLSAATHLVTGFVRLAAGDASNAGEVLKMLGASSQSSRFYCRTEVRLSPAPGDNWVRQAARLAKGPSAAPVLAMPTGSPLRLVEAQAIRRLDATAARAPLRIAVRTGTNPSELDLDIELSTAERDGPVRIDLKSPVNLASGLEALMEIVATLTGLPRFETAALRFPGLNSFTGVRLNSLNISLEGWKTVRFASFDFAIADDVSVLDGLQLFDIGFRCFITAKSFQVTPYGKALISKGHRFVALNAEIDMPMSGGAPWRIVLSGQLNSSLGLDSLMSGALNAPLSSMKQLLDKGGDDVSGADFRGFLLHRLAVEFGGKTSGIGAVSLSMQLDGTIRFAGVEIEDPLFSIECGPGGKIGQALLEGEVGPAGGDFTVTAEAIYDSGQGWTFSGQRTDQPIGVGSIVRSFAGDDADVPKFLSDIVIDDLQLAYRTAPARRFDLTLAAHSDSFETSVAATIQPQSKSLEGAVAFVPQIALETVLAAHESSGILASLAKVGLTAAEIAWHKDATGSAPAGGFAIAALGGAGKKEVCIAFEHRKQGQTASVGAIAALKPEFSIDIADLPVVGGLLPSAELFNLRTLMLVLGDRHEKTFKTVERFVGSSLAGWAVGYGPAICVETSALPAFRIPLDGDARKPKLASPRLPTVATPTAPLDARWNASILGSGSGGGWYSVEKSFGPFALRRIGAQYHDERPWIVLDGSVALGPMAAELRGLAVSIPLAAEAPRFALRGIDLNQSGAGIELAAGLDYIGGSAIDALLDDANWGWLDKKAGRDRLRFVLDGRITASAARAGLAGRIVYAQVADTPVIVAYARATAMIGGPPAFFVTGVIAGLGINATLDSPTVEKLDSYPLIDEKKGFGDVLDVRPGDAWIAAGVTFTSFAVLSGRAVLLAKFGSQLEFALLGSATAQLPPSMPGRPTPPERLFAEITLKMAASLRLQEGEVAVAAVLSASSFLLDRKCRVGGGAAFNLWKNGDFVLSVGGYHPREPVPLHYPRVPRLRLEWGSGDALTISGETYFAVTPRRMMFGSALDMRFRKGGLRAWLHADADAFVDWLPFHFDLTANVRVGVTYTVEVFGICHTFEAEVAAALELYGPPLAGVAHVDCQLVTFDIAIGTGGKLAKPDVGLDDVVGMLPKGFLAIAPAAGLPRRGDGVVAVTVAASGLSISVETAIPVTRFDLNRLAPAPQPERGGFLVPALPAEATSTLSVRLDGAGTAGGWSARVRTARLPAALWGQGDKDGLVEHCIGVELIAPAPTVMGNAASPNPLKRIDCSGSRAGLPEGRIRKDAPEFRLERLRAGPTLSAAALAAMRIDGGAAPAGFADRQGAMLRNVFVGWP